MNHYRNLPGTVCRNVFGSETARHGKIYLHRATLPFAPDGVLEREFDLRTVKCALTRIQLILQATGLQRMLQRGFGLVPKSVVPDPLVGTIDKATSTSLKPNSRYTSNVMRISPAISSAIDFPRRKRGRHPG